MAKDSIPMVAQRAKRYLMGQYGIKLYTVKNLSKKHGWNLFTVEGFIQAIRYFDMGRGERIIHRADLLRWAMGEGNKTYQCVLRRLKKVGEVRLVGGGIFYKVEDVLSVLDLDEDMISRLKVMLGVDDK